MDESTDSADHAQAIFYVWYPDVTNECVITKFFTILHVQGSPRAENLYQTINTFIESSFIPKQKLVLFTGGEAFIAIIRQSCS